LLTPGTTLYITIPPEQLLAQRSLLRCWISTLIREAGATGNENRAETLYLLDEASALGNLPAIEEALVRGRSAGVRMVLAYQSDSQVQTTFKYKPTLIYDNCDTHIFLGVNSYETAERISKSLGDYTLAVESSNTGAGKSWQAHTSQNPNGPSFNKSSGRGWQVQARALLQPAEVMRLPTDTLVAFVRGIPPILCRRIFWYADSFFTSLGGRSGPPLWWWLVLGVAVTLVVLCLNP
jgi:type IV secretion system protein VirD4